MSEDICAEDEQCLPLKTLDEVLNWKQSHHTTHVTAPLLKKMSIPDKPKTLICHDMKGGYLDDKFVHGSKTAENFSFLHWAHTDIFVYFSHWLVTIPPCSWINAAHRNGTLVLGTFITEWDQGLNVCETFLNSTASIVVLCRQLVEIARAHGFDGWLVNIENKIKPNQVEYLEEFVKMLTRLMHNACSHSQVIWYDSVIDNGDLKWQNALNERNSKFFDVCDGIFLNYNWKAQDLKKSVKLAGSRFRDVYVGVDCFGRGSLGGGGYGTNIAVQAARKEGLSVAIFAPGWVFERLDPGNFLENQHKFWGLLSDYLPVRPIKALPFITSFCPGFGSKMYRNGEAISSEAWYNLGLQQPQPDYFTSSFGRESIKSHADDAFNGGGCLLLEDSQISDDPVTFEIFSFNLVLKETVVVSFVYKPLSSEDVDVSLCLRMTVQSGGQSVTLADLKDWIRHGDVTYQKNANEYNRFVKPAEDSDLKNFSYEPIPAKSDWKRKTYILDVKEFRNRTIKYIDVLVSGNTQGNVAILFGHLEIVPRKPKPRFWCSSMHQTKEVNTCMIVKCKLEWNDFSCLYSWDLYYSVDGQREIYIATTSQQFFNATIKLDCQNSEPKNLKFMLQSCDITEITMSKVSCEVDLSK